jgi:hypothetical protein
MTKLEAARAAIAALTDADKWTLLRDQLEGDLCFDSQDACDATCNLTDALAASFERIDEAVDASMDEPDGYDGGLFDFATSRGLNGGLRI